MSTNYYYQEPDRNHCPHCNRYDKGESIHIGKSSAGWCFALHVTDEIRSLDAWQRKWSEGGRIVDEYGYELTPAEMLNVITKRGRDLPLDSPRSWGGPYGYESLGQMLRANQAVMGPNNLLRHASRHCVGYGDGTWDLIEGEFS